MQNQQHVVFDRNCGDLQRHTPIVFSNPEVLGFSTLIDRHCRLNHVDHVHRVGSTDPVSARAAGEPQPHDASIVLDRKINVKHNASEVWSSTGDPMSRMSVTARQ